MNVQQRIDQLVAYDEVTAAGIITETTVQHLGIDIVKVQYVEIVSGIQHTLRTCEMIVYDRGGVNEEAFYYRQMPQFLLRDTYHTDATVLSHIETTYPGAQVIAIRQTVIGDTDRIAVDAKWVDGLYYTVHYRAWGVGLFAQEKVEQMA